MKGIAILLIALVAAGFVAAADAQTGRPADPDSGSVSGPSGSSPGSTSSSPGAPATRSGDGAALPRTAVGERTTIFGLSPTAAVVLAAALLAVVILAIIAMTRSNDTYMTPIAESNQWGASKGPPSPPNARSAPAKPGRSSITLAGLVVAPCPEFLGVAPCSKLSSRSSPVARTRTPAAGR